MDFLSAFVLFALLGLGFGSFGNMLLYRIKTEKSFSGRSFCPTCHHTLAWYDLIPVLSYVFLRARCRYCKTRISVGYPLIELASMGVFLATFTVLPSDVPTALATAFLLWGLLLAVVFDAEEQMIPDLFTAIIFLSAVILIFTRGAFLSSAFGAAIAFIWFGVQWTLSRGRFVGSGDILLGASLGLWLGWRETIVMLFLSYIFGAVWSVGLLVTHRATRQSRIAFGPLLALGAVIAVTGIGEWYFRMLGL